VKRGRISAALRGRETAPRLCVSSSPAHLRAEQPKCKRGVLWSGLCRGALGNQICCNAAGSCAFSAMVSSEPGDDAQRLSTRTRDRVLFARGTVYIPEGPGAGTKNAHRTGDESRRAPSNR
jgi:hypothetical protein